MQRNHSRCHSGIKTEVVGLFPKCPCGEFIEGNTTRPLNEWLLFIKTVVYLCFLKEKKKKKRESWRENLKRLTITSFCFGSVSSVIDFPALRQTKHWVQVAQRGCGISTLGDTQNLTGHGSEEPTVADPALSMDWMRCLPEHLQPHPFCDFWRRKLGRTRFMSCVPLIELCSHGILQPEIPTATPKKRWCLFPVPSHWSPWDTGYGHAGEGTFKQHIWKVPGFWGKSLGTFFFFMALHALS